MMFLKNRFGGGKERLFLLCALCADYVLFFSEVLNFWIERGERGRKIGRDKL